MIVESFAIMLLRSDISIKKAAADKIMSLAFYDPLTELPNRRLLLERLGLALATNDKVSLPWRRTWIFTLLPRVRDTRVKTLFV
jgi:predicted signal transduction protein with EAL and GGDEF domain